MQNVHASRRRSQGSDRAIRRQRPSAAGGALDAPSADALSTLAPPFGQALPTLEHVPSHYNHEVNGELLYALCADAGGPRSGHA